MTDLETMLRVTAGSAPMIAPTRPRRREYVWMVIALLLLAVAYAL